MINEIKCLREVEEYCENVHFGVFGMTPVLDDLRVLDDDIHCVEAWLEAILFVGAPYSRFGSVKDDELDDNALEGLAEY